jgi:peptidoglycan/xylan/chitin deacetylase (PgdA/CDA1 family)/glycosyltransferase involved in cell wall biosynthesis
MNILHVLSQVEVTGAEAYASDLSRYQVAAGHTVFVVSDTLTLPFSATSFFQPISKRSYLQRLKNILWLRRFILEHQIDLVHAHSRAASWVSFIATRLTRTPYVSTVHGRQHIHVSSRSFSVYGRHVIAVCESIREHLLNDLRLSPAHVTVVPNGIDFSLLEGEQQHVTETNLLNIPQERRVILFVGRLTGPKGDVARLLVEKIYPRVQEKVLCSLVLIGGTIVPKPIRDVIKRAQDQFGPTAVVTLGFQRKLLPYFDAADVVIGSGRIAIEALALQRPVLAFGESTYHGPVTKENFPVVLATNFGDAGPPTTPSEEQVVADIHSLLKNTPSLQERHELAQSVRATFDLTRVVRQVEEIYERAILEKIYPRTVPVLLYHRVVRTPPRGSCHGLWVTTQQFESQLRSLQRRGFQAITFRQFDQHRRSGRRLPPKPVILTFDDGYEDNYTEAFPLLKKYGMAAVIFVVTDQRRTNFWDCNEPPVPLMTDDRLRELSSYGIEIGSHTVTHLNVAQADSYRLVEELRSSKQSLEQILGQEVISFAYPYGAVTPQAKEFVRAAGYRYALAGNGGPERFCDDFLEIRRIQIFPWTSRFGFWKKTQRWYHRYKARKSFGKSVSTNAP